MKLNLKITYLSLTCIFFSCFAATEWGGVFEFDDLTFSDNFGTLVTREHHDEMHNDESPMIYGSAPITISGSTTHVQKYFEEALNIILKGCERECPIFMQEKTFEELLDDSKRLLTVKAMEDLINNLEAVTPSQVSAKANLLKWLSQYSKKL